MNIKTSKINTKDLIESITNLYEVMTIILMEGQMRQNRYTDKECDMRTEVVSMAISKVMIEIFLYMAMRKNTFKTYIQILLI